MPIELSDRLDALGQISQLKLLKVLDQIPGQKDLVIDPSLMKCLERIVGMKVLRSHKVNKVFKLAEKDVNPESSVIIYLVRADLVKVKRVCDQIQALSGRDCHIVAIPKVFTFISTLLEEEGLYGAVKLHSYCWELLELDKRLLSLELPELFKFSFVFKDSTYLSVVSKSLWSTQHIFGEIPVKIYVGAHSKTSRSMLHLFNEEKGGSETKNSEFGCLIVMDRDIDYPAVLLTPGTYTSLIADTVGITTGVVEIAETTKQSMTLSSDDDTYNHIKHKHLSYVITYLRQQIKDFYSEQSKRHNMSVQEMKDFVKNDLSKVANQGKILSNHLHLCEKVIQELGQLFEELLQCQQNLIEGVGRKEIVSFIEDLIAIAPSPHLPLRFISLLSMCQGRLTPEESNNLKIQFFHSFGHDHLLTFNKLQALGIVTEQLYGITSKLTQVVSLPRRTAFQTTAQKLKLIPERKEPINFTNPQDASYVFGGVYIPVLVQLIHLLSKKEKTLREIRRLLPGDVEAEDSFHVDGCGLDVLPEIMPKCVLVYVIGGITYAEVAALEYLEKKTGFRIICAGTSVISGNSWAQQVIDARI